MKIKYWTIEIYNNYQTGDGLRAFELHHKETHLDERLRDFKLRQMGEFINTRRLRRPVIPALSVANLEDAKIPDCPTVSTREYELCSIESKAQRFGEYHRLMFTRFYKEI